MNWRLSRPTYPLPHYPVSREFGTIFAMPNMTSYDRGDVVLATLPLSDFTGIKQRPVVVVSVPHPIS